MLCTSPGYLSISFIAIVILVFSLSVVSADEIDTVISVDPEVVQVPPGESFVFNISCVPQYMKSFEIKIAFNASLIHINSISEGSIFEGFTTYFNNGTIDNNAGTVTDVFNLILGQGNVSSPGTLIRISCSSLGVLGESPILLFDVGVTNETCYLPLSVENGSVLVHDGICILNPSPANASDDVELDSESISVDISHMQGELFNYDIVTDPLIGNCSGMNESNGTKTCSLSGLSYDTTYYWSVSVQESSTGDWMNRSFWFTTESEPNDGGGGGGGGGGSAPPEEINLAPVKPAIPSGPIYIEPGVLFSYSSSTYDPDGDTIRYQFQWGDGNFSDWTDLMQGNESVTVTYSWMQTASVTIQVLAQDEHGLNSSWSDGLFVISAFAQEDTEDEKNDSVVADFSYVTNVSAVGSFDFDASMSVDVEGRNVSYIWDFGDGTNATGITATHVFSVSGFYNVTLIVLDDNKEMYRKTIGVFVESSVDTQVVDDKEDSPFVPWFILLLGFFGSIVFIMFLFRKRFLGFFSKKETRINSHDQRSERSTNQSIVSHRLQSEDKNSASFFYRQSEQRDVPSSIDTDGTDGVVQDGTLDTTKDVHLDDKNIDGLSQLDHQIVDDNVDMMLSLKKKNDT
jgi:hypothetical protein